jgi:hypothetical protein
MAFLAIYFTTCCLQWTRASSGPVASTCIARTQWIQTLHPQGKSSTKFSFGHVSRQSGHTLKSMLMGGVLLYGDYHA